MTATASIAHPDRLQLAGNTAQIRATVGGLPVSIATTGDTHTLRFPFLEQVSGLTVAGIDLADTVHFRWGTDGATWSAWIVFNTVNVAAIVLDPDNRFYIEVRVTSVTALPISWGLCFFNITYNPNALAGHGCLTNLGIYGELRDLLCVAIQSQMPTSSSGGARVKVCKSFPEKQSLSQGLFPVYVYNISCLGSEDTNMGGAMSNDLWEARIAIKTVAEVKGSNVGGTPIFEYVKGILRELFDRRTANDQLYSFTFKGVAFVNIQLNELALRNFGMTDRGFGIGENDEYQEFSVKFTVDKTLIQYGNSI